MLLLFLPCQGPEQWDLTFIPPPCAQPVQTPEMGLGTWGWGDGAAGPP